MKSNHETNQEQGARSEERDATSEGYEEEEEEDM